MTSPPPTPPSVQEPWSSSLRWRALFAVAAVAIITIAVGGFVAERRAADLVARSGTLLRAATAAHLAAWNAESAVRAFILLRDSTAPERGGRALRIVRVSLEELRELAADDPEQRARVERAAAAVARWDSVFAAPSFASGVPTLALAVAGTRAFDDVTAAFDAIIESESALRLERIGRQGTVRRVALALLLLGLIVSAIAFARLAQALEGTADTARSHLRRAEEQAGELEEQARQLEEQAAVLEEQATELEHRLEELDDANRRHEQTATFLDSALESAPVGIVFYDADLRFQRVNQAIARINGLDAAAHFGRTVEEVIPHLAGVVRPILERVLKTGRAETDVVLEGETAAAPGVRRRWVVTYYPIAPHGRAPVGVGCMVLDVTERAQLEEQLRQSQKMEAVGRLAGGIAHDFNNILTIIQSYAELLVNELPEGARGRNEMNVIRGAADRATALARQLLAFSRRDVIIPQDVELNEIVEGMTPIVQRLLRQGITLEFALAPSPLTVRADRGQIEQVLMNLAINAVDAMPDGGTLRVVTRSGELASTTDDGMVPAAVMAVEDTGTGIAADVRERLFEPFFTTKPAGQGTGLGLATTYAIIRDAGGSIRVDSVVGNGSRFEVLLPLVKATPAVVMHRQSPMRGSPVARPGETILVAEDEPAIRHALSRVLRGHGYRVLEADNGGEALRLATQESGPIALLLTDLMMPGIGGKELAERLHRARPETRVILMSGYTDDEALRTELGDARRRFLQKPFTASQVVEAVRDLLDGA